MSYLFFISYTRDNRANATDEGYLKQFVEELSNEIRQLDPPPRDDIAFFDTSSIESGEEWEQRLAGGLSTSSLFVSLWSPTYFKSTWCGREFHVFRQRRQDWIRQSPQSDKQARIIFPVLWMPPQVVPEPVRVFQPSSDHYPAEYRKHGLRQLLRLKKNSDYAEFVSTLAQEIVDSAKANPLPRLKGLTALKQIPNAFEQAATTSQGKPAVTGGVSKACFVFLAGRRDEVSAMRRHSDAYGETDSWEWRPYYPDDPQTVGAMAQEITGQLNVRLQELTCDPTLPARLREAKRNRVPTLIIADAWSLSLKPFCDFMTEYDDLNLSNCAALVAWNDKDGETVTSRDQLWQRLQEVCPQKASSPPPLHHWDSIQSMSDLRTLTLRTLEDLRMSMMQVLLQEKVRKAESPGLTTNAAASGISVDSQPRLSSIAVDQR